MLIPIGMLNWENEMCARKDFLAPVLGAARRSSSSGSRKTTIFHWNSRPGNPTNPWRKAMRLPGRQGNAWRKPGICQVARLRNLYTSYCSGSGGGRSKICISHCHFQPGNPENTWLKPMPRPGNLECARLKPMLSPGGGARKPQGILWFRAHPSPPPGESLGKSQAFA